MLDHACHLERHDAEALGAHVFRELVDALGGLGVVGERREERGDERLDVVVDDDVGLSPVQPFVGRVFSIVVTLFANAPAAAILVAVVDRHAFFCLARGSS